MSVFSVVFESPLNAGFAVILLIFAAKFLWKRHNNARESRAASAAAEFEIPPPLAKHDMTLDELKQYNGTGKDKRICIAIRGKVYDCTKGYRFYGVGGPYAPLAGHDATRALAKFDVTAVREDFDDVTDLNESEMESVNEWTEQFNERYDYIGRLCRTREDIVDTVE